MKGVFVLSVRGFGPSFKGDIMGFKQVELVPLGSYGPTAQTPPAKDVLVKAFQVSRTDTVASVKMVLPGSASIVDFLIFGVS